MKTITALNRHKQDLFEGKHITIKNNIYWANMTTREIYCHSIDEEIAGSIGGYKVFDINDSWEIVE